MLIYGELEGGQFETILEAALSGYPAADWPNRVFYLSDTENVVVSNGTAWKTVGATIMVAEFKVNGKLKVGTVLDGKHPLPFAIEIMDVGVSMGNTGSSGTTEVDLKFKATPTGGYSSLFTTTPKFTSAANNDSYVDSLGVTPPGTGITAPVLSGAAIAAGSALAFDVLSVATGSIDCNITIHYRRV